MAKTHAELDQMLDALDAFIPGLVQNKPNARDFWATFQSLADAIQKHAGPDDHRWICDRLDALQVKHHLVPPADQI